MLQRHAFGQAQENGDHQELQSHLCNLPQGILALICQHLTKEQASVLIFMFLEADAARHGITNENQSARLSFAMRKVGDNPDVTQRSPAYATLFQGYSKRPSPLSVACGDYKTFYTFPDRPGIYACGQNNVGQLGVGHANSQVTPHLVQGSEKEQIVAVASAHRYTLFLTASGDVLGAGLIDVKAPGRLRHDPNVADPDVKETIPQRIAIPENKKITAIASGTNFSLFLSTDQTVFFVGCSTFGPFGSGSISHGDTYCETLTRLDLNGEKAIGIAADHHRAFITTKNGVYAWGINGDGALGIGKKDTVYEPTRVPFPTDEQVTSIAIGLQVTAFLTASGNVYITGKHWGWQQPSLEPTLLQTGFKVKAIAAGARHVMLLDTQGNLFALGANYLGQLGLGDNALSAHEPKQVLLPNGQRVKAVAVGMEHTIVMTENKHVLVCGRGGDGQLGLGSKRYPVTLTLTEVMAPALEERLVERPTPR